MNIFAKIGELVIRLFDFIGMLILAIPKIPNKIRNVDTDNIKNKVDTEAIKDNISKIKKDSGIEDRISKFKDVSENSSFSEKIEYNENSISQLSGRFSSEEKEKTILLLQISSATFLVVSILYIFTFLSFALFAIIGFLIVAFILYLLFKRVKLMYSEDFNAYRDFFLMYVAVGIILILISNSSFLVSLFSFQFLPSFSVLFFAVILVMAIFVIFRIVHYRNYTFGTVVESGKRTAYVKVEYDIRSNVKPDIYLVENEINAKEGEIVKIQIEEKLLSKNGNKPVKIIKE
ncbi:DUF2101 family protein [Methanobacterium oryzae]|uniref:DUF2101 family protein n=1 Tax=Methanobacterium oryzae TaxID=69540 RepID=UPI003D24E750